MFRAYIFSILGLATVFSSGFGKPVTKAEVAAAVSELLEQWKRPGDVEIVNDESALSSGWLPRDITWWTWVQTDGYWSVVMMWSALYLPSPLKNRLDADESME